MRQRKISNDDVPSSSYTLCRFYARKKCACAFLRARKMKGDENFLRENVCLWGRILHFKTTTNTSTIRPPPLPPLRRLLLYHRLPFRRSHPLLPLLPLHPSFSVSSPERLARSVVAAPPPRGERLSLGRGGFRLVQMVSQFRLELVEIDFAHGADNIVLFFNVF